MCVLRTHFISCGATSQIDPGPPLFRFLNHT